ncbi:MAG: ABC transporter ATP-binding protein [Actinomycetota bacterium]
MLKIERLVAGYGHVVALKGVDLEVKQGEIVTVIGANGSGKSTLLKTVSGQLKPQRGKVEFEGVNITGRPAEKVVTAGLSLVPEGRQLFPDMSVRENLEMGGYVFLKRRRRAAFDEQLAFVLDLFPVLAERTNQPASTLSGGEQQMLAVGRALMSRPRLLMLDEPSMGLAPKVIKSIFSALDRLNKEGLTILLVEQDANIALNIADRGYVFQTGQCVMDDTGQNLLNDPAVKEIYFGKKI